LYPPKVVAPLNKETKNKLDTFFINFFQFLETNQPINRGQIRFYIYNYFTNTKINKKVFSQFCFNARLTYFNVSLIFVTLLFIGSKRLGLFQ
jgi:hypothetical protein